VGRAVTGKKDLNVMIVMKKNKKEAEEAHETELGWCCACQYDIILLNRKIEIEKEIIFDKIKMLIVEEINIARTTTSGKTSRLTSLMNKVYELQTKNKKEKLTEVR